MNFDIWHAVTLILWTGYWEQILLQLTPELPEIYRMTSLTSNVIMPSQGCLNLRVYIQIFWQRLDFPIPMRPSLPYWETSKHASWLKMIEDKKNVSFLFCLGRKRLTDPNNKLCESRMCLRDEEKKCDIVV